MNLTRNKFVYKTTNVAKQDDKLPTSFQFRLTGKELERLHVIIVRGRQRNKYATDSDFFREIAGVNKPDLLTQAEIDFFFGRIDSLELSKSKNKGSEISVAELNTELADGLNEGDKLTKTDKRTRKNGR